jgi:hypothetical protein
MTTIYLSTKKNIAYYLTSITTKQKDKLYEIKSNKNINEATKQFESLTSLWGINCNGILKIGETSKIRREALSDYMGWFKGKDTTGNGTVGYNREIHFRNYLKTEEQQRETMHLINQCQDSNSSIKSAVQVMKNEWCILWETPINTPLNIKIQQLLKDKVCYTENL